MPYRDREAQRANDRERYQRNREPMKAAAKTHYEENREAILAGRKQRRTPEQRARDTAAMRIRHAAIRAEMIAAYGSRCVCCGESEPIFLDLDHIKSDGHQHRKQIGRGSGATYRYLKKLGWPRNGYQLLCANCNAGRARNGGVCPHGR